MSVTGALLARHVRIAADDVALFLNCAGDAATLLATSASAARVVITDRNFALVRAALAEVGAGRGEVLHSHGTLGLDDELVADVVVVRTPREKIAALQLINDAFRALRADGVCYVVGATTDGIKSVVKTATRVFGNAEVLAHDSSHRIVLLRKTTRAPLDPGALDSPYLDHDAFHRIDTHVRGNALTLYTRPGVFSWDHVDEATTLLAEVMTIGAGKSVLDIGCGAGALGIVAARLSRTGRVMMVDADSEAVRCARRNADTANMPHVEVRASDVASAVTGEHFDVVVSNPPFHAGGRTADLTLPRRFIEEAHDVLDSGGRMMLVANRTLPYERMVEERFGSVQMLHENARFKVITATRRA